MKKSIFYTMCICLFIWSAVPINALARIWTADDVREMLGNGENQLYTIVYVTDTGYRYHSWNCHYLISCNPISLLEAIENEYTPCLHCKPYPIPDSYYDFQDMSTEGDFQTAVFVYDDTFHRKACPKLEDNYLEYTLENAYKDNYFYCKYCNPPKLNYAQIQEVKGKTSYREPIDWLENPILTLILIVIGAYIGYSMFIYFREIYRAIKENQRH